MLILDIIFDYVLFLSKKEIYKERKFSFLSYQNLRFWGKRDRTWHKSAISSIFTSFIRNFEEISRYAKKYKSSAFRFRRNQRKCFIFEKKSLISLNPLVFRHLGSYGSREKALMCREMPVILEKINENQ